MTLEMEPVTNSLKCVHGFPQWDDRDTLGHPRLLTSTRMCARANGPIIWLGCPYLSLVSRRPGTTAATSAFFLTDAVAAGRTAPAKRSPPAPLRDTHHDYGAGRKR
jgi:hypothetical protein